MGVAPNRWPAAWPPSGIYACKPGGPNNFVYVFTSHANPEDWRRLLKVVEREDLLDVLRRARRVASMKPRSTK
jgi:crotonobetainyl-CoA:carnitine CoA-transferase CaiB-like acyl-CoA transferase